MAEAPTGGAEPAQVTHRVTDVGDLPVQHGTHAGRVDHQVAVAEVSVDEGHLAVGGQVVQEPPGGEVDHRLGTAEPLVALPRQPDLVFRADLAQDVA